MKCPQTFATPPYPHVSPAIGQVPQSMVAPQPSAIAPQFAPTAAHVVGVQTVTHAPFLQVEFVGHVPHDAVTPPHPSATCPQTAPRAVHVVGVHGFVPHTPGTPEAPQPVPAGQLPQSRMPPQPSAVGPQLTPSCRQVFAWHERPTQRFDPLQ